jgi:hypothetical protein
MRPYIGPPATLGTTLAAGVDLGGDCLGCRRDVHVDTAQLEMLADRYGRDAILLDLIARLTCAECSGKLDVRVHVPRLAKFEGRA